MKEEPIVHLSAPKKRTTKINLTVRFISE